VADNVASVAVAAKSTTEGASNTQTAAAELSRMAGDLQRLVGQFKYDAAGGLQESPAGGGGPSVPASGPRRQSWAA